MRRWMSHGYAWKLKTTGLSGVKMASNSRSVRPWGCSVLGTSLNRYDVHEPDLRVREVLAQQGGGGQGLHRRHVAAARHDHIGFGPLVVAGPIPEAEAFRAVRDRRLHVQILQVDLFVRDDHVDVVEAAQAVVGN